MSLTSPFPVEVSRQAGLDYLVSRMQAAVMAYQNDPNASDSREKHVWWVNNLNQEMVHNVYYLMLVLSNAKLYM